MPIDLASIEPFEICSIRPPTENYSLTFRLTRNCYWNSLESRIQSFMGQYGGLSEDISKVIGPYTAGGRLNMARMPDEEIRYVIRLIRSKLMP